MLSLTLFVIYLSLVSPLQNKFQKSFIRTTVNLKVKQQTTGSISSISSHEKNKYTNFAKFTTIGFSSLFIKSKPASAIAATIFPECSESITVFRKGDQEAVIIGTAHISEESAKLVERTIEKLHPNIVMIELDPKRIGKFSNLSSLSNAGFDVPSFAVDSYSRQADSIAKLSQRKPSLFETVINGIRSAVGQLAQGVSGAILGRFLAQFYKSFEKLGFQTGAEFKVAVTEGQRQGARILLGDRDVDITLQRLSSAISGTDPDSFDRLLSKMEGMEVFEAQGGPDTLKGFQGDMDKERVSQFVESLKQRAGLRQMAATLKEELPLVYEALIGERDLYMAHAIADAGAGASSTLSTTTTKTTGTGTRTGTEGVLVGVVGMMHLDGIEKHLVAEYGYKIVSTNCPRNADEVVESNKWSPSRSYENIIIS